MADAPGQTKVDEQSAEVAEMAAEWPMLEALMGGTRKMREAGDKLLPRWPGEDQDSWTKRKETATLFPAFRRTDSVMSGKPFAKEATLSDDAPPEIQAWAEDIDREGVSLHAFAAEMLSEALAYGLCGILVESPKPTETGRPVATVAEQKAAGIRPYFVRVKHRQLLGWRCETVDGARKLTQLRISECRCAPDGDFGSMDIPRVRVLEPGSWRVFEKLGTTGEEKWVVVESGVTTLDYIPFVPLYGQRTGLMCGVSPLLDLAYLNVKHWQSQSDQDTITHVARVPILHAKGFADKEEITVGAQTAVRSQSTEAELVYVEHTGAAIDAGSKSLADLEEQMIQAGAELLVKTPGDRSATESANDAEANKSDLQRIVETFEDSLDAALQMMADYATLPSGGNVTLYKDFGATTLSAATAQLITTWVASGMITKETGVRELQRRGELSPDIDPEVEIQAATDEAPVGLAPMTPPADPNTPPEDKAALAA